MKINYNIKLLLVFLFLMLVYFFLRMGFYLFNQNYFSEINGTHLLSLFFYGLRFDASAIFTLNFIFAFFFLLPVPFLEKFAYRVFLKVLFLVLNIPAILFSIIDFAYFNFINTRTTAEIFSYVFMSKDVLYLLPQFLKDFWYVAVLFSLIVFLFWKGIGYILKTVVQVEKNRIFYVGRILSLFFWVGLSIILIRGGFQLRPITISSASQYTETKNIPLVINTPFNIIRTINKDRLIVNNFFSTIEEAEAYYSPVRCYKKNDTVFSEKNVVVFILESFSKEYIGALNKHLMNGNYKGYTPFLDSIINHSIVFENAYANSKRSIDATLSIITGIPNLMNTAFILSGYASNNINSMASLLNDKEYTSSFFHGGTNGTMGFDNFSNLAGFGNYYGRTEYNNDEDFDGKWGIFDEPFLQYMALKIDEMKSPFLSVVFTVSSHHPYTIPDKYEGTFPKGTLKIHESIAYTDFALKRFFETASKMSWFENTVFVFTADHTGEAYFPEYKTKHGMYAVPLFFYIPDCTHQINSEVAQHTDIFPTLLDILHYDEPFVAYGSSLLNTDAPRLSVNYADNIYQLVYENYVLFFDGDNLLSLFNIKNDKLLKNNILNIFEPEEINDMTNLLKAYIQSYQYRMTMNKLSLNSANKKTDEI